ncbi:MAG: pilus assembly protein PilP [Thiobacillus sp.]|nr:pilus assembly protein PilP [Thiobacillus sp.]
MRTSFLAPVAVCLVLAGCGNDGFDDLRAFMESTGKDGGSKIEPLPAIKVIDTFEYRQDNLQDPFLARNLRPTGKDLPEADRPKEPLEEYPLDALSMVGTLKKPGQPLRAVIKAKEPKGGFSYYTIKVGARIGLNFGKVTAINDDSLEIKELMQDAQGEWSSSKALMSMTEEAAR